MSVRTFSKSPKTPSRFTRLSTLLQIKLDNCIGQSGTEYSKHELDQLIIEKQMKKASESVTAANKDLFVEAAKALNPEPCPFQAELDKSEAATRWYFISHFDNIHNEPTTRAQARRKYSSDLRY